MNLTVYIGPDQSANLKELLRRTPLGRGAACAVVPDFRSVTALERRLTELSGGAFTGHKIYTMEGLSRAIISLTGNVPGTIGNHVKKALLTEIVKSRIGNQSRYSDVSGYPGFVRLLSSFLEDIRSSTDGNVTKNYELVAIATAYQLHLNRLGMTDHEGAVVVALKSGMIETFAQSFEGPIIIDGFYDLTDKQIELLSGLFKNFGRSAVNLVYDRKRPSLFALSERLISVFKSIGAKIIEVESNPSSGPDFVLSGFMGGSYSGMSECGEVEIHTFQSESSEADWIAGTIRTMLTEYRYKPETIMIVSRNAPVFGGVFDATLKRHGIPVDSGIARPIMSHPLIKLALNALEASINPEENNILNIQNSCYTGRGASHERKLWDSMDDRGWSCMISEVDSPEGFVSSMKEMLEALEIKYNLNCYKGENIAVFETVMYQTFIELLDEFARFYSSFRPLMRAEEFSRLLTLFLGDSTISDRTSPGRGVVLAGVNQARYVSREVVFFRGLDNSSFPAQNDIYSLHDPEFALKIRNHKDMEEGILFYMAISGAKRLFLTFPGIDDEGKDSSMSPYLREIQKVVHSSFHTGVTGSAWEGGYVTGRGRSENVIRILRDGSDSDSMISSLKSCDSELYEEIERALDAYIKFEKNQNMNLSTEDSKEILAEKWGKKHIFSVTDFEMYNSCPIKFFLIRILGLQPKFPAVDGLDHSERGIIIHEILAQFYKTLFLRKDKTSFTRNEFEYCTVLMQEIVDSIFHSHAGTDRLKKQHPVILSSEKRYIQRWMNYFLELEADYFENSPFYPHLFEINFGNGSYPPLELEHADKKIMVKGRIDRIDIAEEDGRPYSRVIDYKTGQKIKKKDIDNGSALQIPLYIKAVNENILPEIPVQSGVYYHLRYARYDRKKKQLRDCTVFEHDIDSTVETACINALHAAFSIGSGLFPAPSDKCNAYCEWRGLCRGGYSSDGESNDADI